MRFGRIATADADQAILAHSLSVPGGKLKKGTVLGPDEIAKLTEAGIHTVTAGVLENGYLSENDAALVMGTAFKTTGLRLGAVFTGRVNLLAEHDGVVRVDAAAIAALNGVDEGLTLATLPDYMRVHQGQLVGTVKIIPYGLPGAIVQHGAEAMGPTPITLHPFQGGEARLVMTRTSGFKASLLEKGTDAVRKRLDSLGYKLSEVTVVDHEQEAVAKALKPADLVLVLGASATSDRGDVAPAAVLQAGGQIDRFGMPVDPGNLLFLGQLDGAPVVGLPGCARSPALNGVDWVLERLSARLTVTGDDVAAMGVGGLLKEMAGRPQPRNPKP
ncbi:MAG: molybdopterin-binding protein [Pseudomonadota bacterium]